MFEGQAFIQGFFVCSNEVKFYSSFFLCNKFKWNTTTHNHNPQFTSAVAEKEVKAVLERP